MFDTIFHYCGSIETWSRSNQRPLRNLSHTSWELKLQSVFSFSLPSALLCSCHETRVEQMEKQSSITWEERDYFLWYWEIDDITMRVFCATRQYLISIFSCFLTQTPVPVPLLWWEWQREITLWLWRSWTLPIQELHTSGWDTLSFKEFLKVINSNYKKEGFLEKNGLNLLIRKHQNVRFQTRRFCVEMYRTLLPRIKASPYLFFSWPLAYSSVWSSAIFMYPSRQARTPVNVYRMIPDLFYNRKYTRITSVINTTVQLYNNWTPMDLIDELGESFLARHFTKNLSFLPETRIFVYNNITSNLWSSRFH